MVRHRQQHHRAQTPEANLVFLAETSADFAPLQSANDLMARIGDRLARHLNLSRCAFSIVDDEADRITPIYDWRPDNDTPALLREYPISMLLTEAGRAHYRLGKLAAIGNAYDNWMLRVPPETLTANRSVAIVDAPYLENGHWRFLLTVARAEAGEWRADELDLIRELAARIYIRLERARAEEALRESEAHHRTLFNAVDEAVCLLERLPLRADGLRDYRYIAVNPAMQAMFHIPDLTGQTIRENFPDEAEAWYDDYDRVLATGQPIRFERESAPQGMVLDMFITRLEDGSGKQLLAVMQNVTVRKRNEEALRASETRLQLALDAAAMGTAIWHIHEDRSEPDARMLALFDLPPDATLSFANVLNDYVHPDDRARFYSAVQRAIRPSGTGQFREDFRIVHPDQSEHWLTGIGHTLFEGEPPHADHMIVAAMDVTFYKRAEAEARESEERYRLLVEGTKEYAMFLLDIDGHIAHWNTGAERVFGFKPEEIVGRNAAMLFTPEDQAIGVPQREIETASIAGRAMDQRWHMRRDGSRFWADGILSSLHDESGVLRGFVKIARDATRERKAEEALRHAYGELETRVAERTAELQASQEQLRQLLLRTERIREDERFRIAREVHDELGGAITALKFGVHQMGRSASDASALTDLRGELDTQLDDLLQSVRRIASELHTPLLDDFGLIAAIEWQVTDWGKKTGMKCVLQIPDEEVGLEKVRRSAMFRVLQETLTNITRHAKGATQVNITVEVTPPAEDKPETDTLALTVTDNGCGIDLKTLQPGKSLGVLNMRERMREVDGTLTIISTLGQGTTISASMPIQE